MKSIFITPLWAALVLTCSTSAGWGQIQLLKDIYPGTSSGSPREFVNLGSETFFIADDTTRISNERWQLWKTNGTAAGTVKVTEMTGKITFLTTTGTRLFFVRTVMTPSYGQTVWTSDGTAGGTSQVMAGLTSQAESLTVSGTNLYFIASPNSGILYKTNATASNATLSASASDLTAGDGGALYFVNPSLAQRGEVMKTDGTVGGTGVLKDIVPGSTGSNPKYLRFWNGRLYFQANDQIWRSDGTEAGTERVDTVTPLTASSAFCPAGGHLYFSAVSAGIRGLYRTNGNVGHTELLGTHASLLFTAFGRTYPCGALELNGRIMFDGLNTGNFSQELWAWTPSAGIARLGPVNNWADMAINASWAWNHVFVINSRAYYPSTFGFGGDYYTRTDSTPAGTPDSPLFINFHWQLRDFVQNRGGFDSILRPEGIIYGGKTPSGDTELYLYPTPVPPASQLTWRQTYFGTTADAGDAADNFDFDQDGLVNVLEFALGKDPKVSSPQTATTAVVTTNLEFYYSRATAAVSAGYQFIVEWSDSLTGVWSSTGVSSVVQSDNGTIQQVKATLPAGSQMRRFVRLRVLTSY